MKYILKFICPVFILMQLCIAVRVHAQECPILPAPLQSVLQKEQFSLDGNIGLIVKDKELTDAGKYLSETLRSLANVRLVNNTSNVGTSKQIVLKKISKKLAPEGYIVSMNSKNIVITSNSNIGIINGINSLLQLVLITQVEKMNSTAIPCWNIQDAPKYAWRGYMLDESRYFFGKDVVKKILDLMALYKLNIFHWHLTDEPGWRIEIKQYPLLTIVGGKGDYQDSSKPSQYYTQADIKEIVNYATQRGITIIPEIDMPGHATAANKAYPQYSGGGSAKHPEFTFNPGLNSTYSYLTNILKEVVDLFPSKMIHIGGDEVSFGNEKWETDPAIVRLKQEKGLKTSLDVEHYFITRMADSLKSLNCKLVGWDEITDVALDPKNTIVMWWRHDHPEQLKNALDKGFAVVACPRLPLYFDFVQDGRDKVGRRWAGAFNTLKSVYSFNIDSLVPPAKRKLLLGTQANIWTEQVASNKRLYYMTFPRLIAAAENAWLPTSKLDYATFEQKVQLQNKLLDKLGVYYYNVANPELTPEVIDVKKKVQYLDNAK